MCPEPAPAPPPCRAAFGAAGAAAQGGTQRRTRAVSMIRDGREYAVTKSWVEKFEDAVAGMDPGPPGKVDKILEAERTGLQSRADEMRGDIAEYDALVSGSMPTVDAGDLEGLPEMLIKARICLGMTRRELAERLGMREEQVRRHERTGYESAACALLLEARAALLPGAAPAALRGGVPDEAHTMSRIKAAGLGRGFVDDCILGTPRSAGGDAAAAAARAALLPGADLAALRGGVPDEAHTMSRIKAAGLGRGFVDDCILGTPRSAGGDAAAAAARERKLLSRLYKIYGWTPDKLLGSAPLETGPVPAGLELSAGADRAVVRAHAVYAGHMAGILAGAAHGARRHPPYNDPYRLRADLLGGAGGAVTFPRLVEHSWDAGIAVAHLPPLSFRAAYFGGEEGAAAAGVIVLARADASESGLLLDLARGLWHAARGRDGIDAGGHGAGAEESEADRFAHAVLVGPRADRMFGACMDACAPGRGALDTARLGRAVLEAALEEGARADSLADYVAYRLAGEPACSWRGAARGMQVEATGWRADVTAAMLARADLARLSDSDFAILSDVMGAG